jgi:hypothetical protein
MLKTREQQIEHGARETPQAIAPPRFDQQYALLEQVILPDQAIHLLQEDDRRERACTTPTGISIQVERDERRTRGVG